MTALLVTYVFPPRIGGSGRWFWEVYKRLQREDFIIAADDHPEASAFDKSHDLRLFRITLSFSQWGIRSHKGIMGYWQAFRAIRQIIKRHHVTVLHCGACLPDGWIGYLCYRFYGIPYMAYMHGEELSYAGNSRELNWMCRKVLKCAQFVVANSKNTQSILLDKWQLPFDKIRILTPGVDCQRFTPAPRDAQIRRQMGWHDRPVVLTVGRLQKRKGHDALIRAIPSIREHIPDVLYSIVGGGEERENLELLVQKLAIQDYVQFFGEATETELIKCYQQCDLFALPNRQIGDDLEGFGIVLVEAQACGKPVIAGNTGGTAETMNIPSTGMTLDCDDIARLSDTITKLLLDPERVRSMGTAARCWAVDNFDWQVLSARANVLLFPQ